MEWQTVPLLTCQMCLQKDEKTIFTFLLCPVSLTYNGMFGNGVDLSCIFVYFIIFKFHPKSFWVKYLTIIDYLGNTLKDVGLIM
jgi:hypothetical protein